MPRYNHAYDVAFEVITNDPEGATPEECLAALERRLADLKTLPPEELNEVFGVSMPIDTYEMQD